MSSLLIVDDEIFAVKGIKKGIDWDEIGIHDIYEAYDAEEALDIVRDNEIDLIICDIEMPGMNGLQLLEKINDVSPDTLTIMLTGHAKFNYAQIALKYGCFDYLLKPIEHKKIEETVISALEKIEKEKEANKFLKTYNKFSDLWKKQNPILVERFWQDIFSQRIFNYSQLSSVMELYNIPLKPDDRVIPILLSIEVWQAPLSGKDEEILKYGLKNMATEILKETTSGVVFQNHDGNIIMLIYPDLDNGFIDNVQINKICNEIINIAETSLHCVLSCYISDPTLIRELEKQYLRLLDLERNNIGDINTIIYQSDYSNVPNIYPQIPDFTNWQLLFELGRKDELMKEVDDYFSEKIDEMANCEFLENFYFGFLSMIYNAIHKKDISVQEVFDVNKLHDLSSIRSYNSLQKKIKNVLNQGYDYFIENTENSPVIIKKIYDFIQDNFREKLTRKDIATHVYLNPAYLSRLFKKETGMTLTEYITELRINEAKKLLVETDYTITAIAEEIGYYNYSYFSKIFKEIVGFTAGEYRKNYQKLK
ncbi:MAG: response regulator transcription factor [Bacillota bacterium]